ncbi:MAG: ABC-2 transporter permease [Ruminococcus sp.]|nr:ABC-2 transporter permease [Ruminococcus sp.]
MMKGLLTKEFIVFLKTARTQIFIILMFIILGILMKNTMYIMFVPLLLPMIAKQGLTVDEISKWDKYSACFPVDRKKIVTSKYLLIFIISIAAFIITAISLLVIKNIKPDPENPVGRITPYLAAAAAESLILPSLSLPFDFKFGTAKGKVMYFIVTAFAAALLSATTMLPDKQSILSKISNPSLIITLAFCISAVVFIVSWLISTKIYEAKEI